MKAKATGSRHIPVCSIPLFELFLLWIHNNLFDKDKF